MDLRIPTILHPLLQEHTDSIKQDMPGQVAAVYLEGSIALGEFNPRWSDIDFITVLNGRATTDEFRKILRIHRKAESQYPSWKMSGMYSQVQDLGCQNGPKEPFPTYHDGKLNWTDRFELGLVTWWILKNHGIALFGLPPLSLDITVNMEDLIQLQQKNLNTYWATWKTRPGRIGTLTTNWGVQWTVLGVLRQFYTIHEQQITSKIGAGEYALSCLPECWHLIIREAIAIGQTPNLSYYWSRIKRAFDAIHFLKTMIQSCNDFLAPVQKRTVYK
jgi:hypothetical protein